ncbi:hypothetical protein SKAU_G00266010 [Synaphobranchus kaupii]|uniref:Uncharacterized protein n=1 Tax=Synaphobranchus kaupii TaxID=118154 RepID=A0A9Q1EZC3_SYNKA|nr:hypothetical protein SKAU_G00266010 [Synaphobranchus kaupii]
MSEVGTIRLPAFLTKDSMVGSGDTTPTETTPFQPVSDKADVPGTDKAQAWRGLVPAESRNGTSCTHSAGPGHHHHDCDHHHSDRRSLEYRVSSTCAGTYPHVLLEPWCPAAWT